MLRSARREDTRRFVIPAYNPGKPVQLAGEVGHWAGFCAEHCVFLHQFAESLGNTVDARDALTFNHSREVADVSYMLARAMGLPSAQAEAVHIAGHLHDIGKIGIPDAVLKKEGELNADDWRWLWKHPEIGAKIVEPVQAFSGAGGIAEIIKSHHERFDGKGYPNAVKGDTIPLGARIIAVADTLSALLQDRPYRRGTSFEAAVKEIVSCSATQFDPAVVNVLREIQNSVGSYFLRKLFTRGKRSIDNNASGDISVTGSRLEI